MSAAGPSQGANRGPSTAAKVLVVDDTPQNVKLLVDVLQAKGYTPIAAASGEEALARLADAPDIVLLDVMMPGLSGYDVCRRIRDDPATALLPVILVTSLDPHGERLKGIEAGADDFVQKPFNQAELLARVRSLLRIKSLQDEVARQAAELRDWNATLESRVQASLAEVEKLGRLKRFFSAPVAEAIVSAGDASLLAPHRRDICCVFVDLRGFTAFTDSAEPEEVMAVLGEFHAAMGGLITEHGGTVPHFAGDGILIFFNDPLPVPDPCERAARMALAMQSRFVELGGRWQKMGYDLQLGIGIARGFATLGAVGYEERVDYSAIGSVVNLAARLCGEAQAGQILLDRRARAALEDGFRVEPLAPLTLKGFDKPVPAFLLAGAV